MKKEYTRPAATALTLETEPLMITTSTETGNAGVGNKPVGGDTPDLVKGYGNGWNNIWE